MSVHEIPLRVHDLTPAEAAEWDAFDASAEPGMGRVSCSNCAHRSGFMCIPLKTSAHPLHLLHRCEDHSKRVEFPRKA